MWTIVLHLLANYRKDLFYCTLLLIAVFGTCYVKDRYHTNSIAKQEQVISDLQKKFADLQQQKVKSDQAVQEALFSYDNEKRLTDTLRKRLDVQIAKNQRAETAEESNAIQQQLLTNNDVKLDDLTPLDACRFENTQLVRTVEVANISINALKVDKDLTEKLLDNSQTQNKALTGLTTELKTDLETQSKRKKAWRTTALGEAAVIITAILVHLL